MNIEKTVNGSSAVIGVEGWLDTQTAPELGKAVEELGAEVEQLTLDLAKLEYISSAGLRQIVALHKKLKKLTIVNASREIMEVFKMTGFDKRLDIQ